MREIGLPPQQHRLVHQILTLAHARLAGPGAEEFPHLAPLLSCAADHVPAEDLHGLDEQVLAQAVAEAAAHLAASASITLMPSDPRLDACLEGLDQLPRAARIDLLAAAIRNTASEAAPPLAPRDHRPDGRTPFRSRPTGACPCACSSGGYCGGCGHAGCGGQR
jgi:hypothetical protein